MQRLPVALDFVGIRVQNGFQGHVAVRKICPVRRFQIRLPQHVRIMHFRCCALFRARDFHVAARRKRRVVVCPGDTVAVHKALHIPLVRSAVAIIKRRPQVFFGLFRRVSNGFLRGGGGKVQFFARKQLVRGYCQNARFDFHVFVCKIALIRSRIQLYTEADSFLSVIVFLISHGSARHFEHGYVFGFCRICARYPRRRTYGA